MKTLVKVVLWGVLLYFLWNIVIVPVFGAIMYINGVSNGGLFSVIAFIVIVGCVLSWLKK